MVAQPAILNRRRRTWLIVSALLIAATVVTIGARQKTKRVAKLVAEIEDTGGGVRLGDPTYKRLWFRVRGWRDGYVDDGNNTEVFLPLSTDDRWLLAHDNLSDLEISDLSVPSDAAHRVSGSQLAALVQDHPIESFTSRGCRGADEVAKALSNKPDLWWVELGGSDLTDTGLRRMPLEQLTWLGISESSVTTSGLAELKRCIRLQHLTIDGLQFSPSDLFDVIQACPDLWDVTVTGEEVDEEKLRLFVVKRTRASPTTIRDNVGIRLSGTEATQEVIDDLNTELAPWWFHR